MKSPALIAARALELSGRIPEARAACESYLKDAPQGADAAEARKILARLAAASLQFGQRAPGHCQQRIVNKLVDDDAFAQMFSAFLE